MSDNHLNPPSEPEPVYDPFPAEESYQEDNRCPHGQTWGLCDTCDHLADIAHDEARERRLFR